MYQIYDIPKEIDIGKQGESGILTLEFDVSSWLVEWPGAVITATYFNPVLPGLPPLPTSQAYLDGDIFKIKVLRNMTVYPGKAEITIRLAVGDDIEKHSETFRVAVERSHSLTSGTMPDILADWITYYTNRWFQVDSSATTVEAGNPAAASVTQDEDGTHFAFVVPRGDQGIQGEAGLQGATGPQGIQGIQGVKGYTGDTGPQGIQGIQGETGPQGPIGAGLNILGSFSTVNELPASGNVGDAYLILGDLYIWTGTLWDNAGNIQGPQGIQGIQGETGPQGIQGIQGETGPQGIQGIQGETGLQGIQGATGASGADGISAYLHVKYAAAQPDSNDDMTDTPSAWIGIYSGTSATAPVNYTDYDWYNIKGDKGDVNDHDHDSDYSAIGHDHDSDYSAIGHDHDSDYSAIGHDHDSDYSAIGHDHDSDYLGIAAQAADSDKLDGYDASNATASIPISNGTVNTNLNADKLDGHHASDLMVGNPNILHNYDFRNPVNQREVSGAITTGTYFYDRWIRNSGTVTVAAGYLTIGASAEIEQRIEGNLLAGETVTVSVMAGGTVYSGTGIMPTSGTASVTLTGWGTATLGYATGYMYVRLAPTAASNVVRVKLEFGKVSTLAYDPPMDYGVELAKCQRYFINLGGHVPFVGSSPVANEAEFLLHAPNMRINPSISSTALNVRYGGAMYSGNVHGLTARNGYVKVNSSGHAGLPALQVVSGYLDSDNVSLSADL